MPLQKAKKSVLFHKGIADGTDRFLLDPPSIDYAENLTLGKDGSFSKRYGFTDLGSVTTATETPFALEIVNDNLLTVDAGGVHTFSGTAWEKTEFEGFIAESDIKIETGPIAGAAHMSYSPHLINGVVTAQVIVMEIRENTASDDTVHPTDTKVFIYGYDAQGNIRSTHALDNCRSPKVIQLGGAQVVTYFKEGDGLKARFFLPITGVLYDEVDLAIIPVFQARLESHGGWDFVYAGTFANRAVGRIGESYDWEIKYQIAADDQGLEIFWTDDDGVVLTTYDVNLNKTNTLVVYQTASVDITADAFDVVIQGAYVHVLFSIFDHTGATMPEDTIATIEYRPYDRTTHAPVAAQQTIKTLPNRTFVNGSIAVGLVGEVLIAYTDGGLSNWWDDARDGTTFNEKCTRTENSALRWRAYNWVTDTLDFWEGILYHHRLVSDLAYSDGKYYALTQQWFDTTPTAWEHEIVDINDYVSVLGALKPVTTSLVQLKLPGAFEPETAYPLAYFNPGNSAHTDPSESYMSTHRLDLHLVGSEFLFVNRVVYQAPDISLWFGKISVEFPPFPAEDVPFRIARSESQAKAGAQVYSVHPVDSANTLALGDGLVLESALPLWISTRQLAEFCPLDSPEIVSVTDAFWTADGTRSVPIFFNEPANLAPGTYHWRKFNVVLGYSDRYGNIHRSAPSTTVYVGRLGKEDADDGEFPYAGQDVTVTFTAPLSILRDGSSLFAELYVSDTGDSDAVLVGTKTFSRDPSLSNFQIESQLVRLQPSVADESEPYASDRYKTLQARIAQPLYTLGDILAADPWPPFTLATATSTRLWAIDPINKGRVMPSKLFEDYIAPEYNSSLAINLGDERNLTAIGKLDDKVIVFEPNDIHVIYGDGPDNRGQGQEFAVHYISTDVGCQDQKSIIETPLGLIFYSSPRGFYLLDRNLQIQFIGAPIEDIATGIRVKAATLDPGNAEVRFLVEPDPNESQTDGDGPDPDTTLVARPPRPVFGNELPANACLVFLYETGDWMLYTNYPGVAACVYQRRYTRLLTDWTVWQESDEYTDPTGTNRTLLRSPWIKLSESIQDYQRLWRISFLGRYLSSLRGTGDDVYEAGDIVVRLYFDYEATYAQEKRFRMQDFGFDPFNHVLKRAERLQFEVTPMEGRGRCQAVKIEIEEVNSEDQGEGINYSLGHGFEIVSAELFMGVAPSMRALMPQAVKQ
jgi:hypothetical protein